MRFRTEFVLAICVLALAAAAGLATGQDRASAAPLTGMASVTTGSVHTCALTASGGVKCWGEHSFGELGNTALTDTTTPVDVTGLTGGVAAISSGFLHTCALTTTGRAKCWGWNDHGQLGNGTTGTGVTPEDVNGLTSGVAAVSAGASSSCALTTSGGVKCWGRNDSGQLGNGTTMDSSVPVDVSGLTTGAAAISPGGSHTCALTTGGGVKCWGDNTFGELGNGTSLGVSNAPVDVSGLTSGVAAVSAGGNHTCALTTSGGVKCWGDNESGQLGDGTMSGPQQCGGASHRIGCSTVPVDVTLTGLVSTAARVSAGSNYTCAITTGRGIYCWGDNGSGQLGDGTTTTRSTPVSVVGAEHGAADAVSTGTAIGYFGGGLIGSTPVYVGAHTCAAVTGGGIFCWGANTLGELGDGTTANRTTPVAVVASPPYPVGDVNCDGAVNSIDAALVLQHDAGLANSLDCRPNADWNHDGQVNSLDAALILQYSAGLITSLPT